MTQTDDQLNKLLPSSLFPDTKAVQSLSSESLNVAAAGPVFAHIDPRRPYTDNRAGMYSMNVEMNTIGPRALNEVPLVTMVGGSLGGSSLVGSCFSGLNQAWTV